MDKHMTTISLNAQLNIDNVNKELNQLVSDSKHKYVIDIGTNLKDVSKQYSDFLKQLRASKGLDLGLNLDDSKARTKLNELRDQLYKTKKSIKQDLDKSVRDLAPQFNLDSALREALGKAYNLKTMDVTRLPKNVTKLSNYVSDEFKKIQNEQERTKLVSDPTADNMNDYRAFDIRLAKLNQLKTVALSVEDTLNSVGASSKENADIIRSLWQGPGIDDIEKAIKANYNIGKIQEKIQSQVRGEMETIQRNMNDALQIFHTAGLSMSSEGQHGASQFTDAILEGFKSDIAEVEAALKDAQAEIDAELEKFKKITKEDVISAHYAYTHGRADNTANAKNFIQKYTKYQKAHSEDQQFSARKQADLKIMQDYRNLLSDRPDHQPTPTQAGLLTLNKLTAKKIELEHKLADIKSNMTEFQTFYEQTKAEKLNDEPSLPAVSDEFNEALGASGKVRVNINAAQLIQDIQEAISKAEGTAQVSVNTKNIQSQIILAIENTLGQVSPDIKLDNINKDNLVNETAKAVEEGTKKGRARAQKVNSTNPEESKPTKAVNREEVNKRELLSIVKSLSKTEITKSLKGAFDAITEKDVSNIGNQVGATVVKALQKSFTVADLFNDQSISAFAGRIAGLSRALNAFKNSLKFNDKELGIEKAVQVFEDGLNIEPKINYGKHTNPDFIKDEESAIAAFRRYENLAVKLQADKDKLETFSKKGYNANTANKQQKKWFDDLSLSINESEAELRHLQDTYDTVQVTMKNGLIHVLKTADIGLGKKHNALSMQDVEFHLKDIDNESLELHVNQELITQEINKALELVDKLKIDADAQYLRTSIKTILDDEKFGVNLSPEDRKTLSSLKEYLDLLEKIVEKLRTKNSLAMSAGINMERSIAREIKALETLKGVLDPLVTAIEKLDNLDFKALNQALKSGALKPKERRSKGSEKELSDEEFLSKVTEMTLDERIKPATVARMIMGRAVKYKKASDTYSDKVLNHTITDDELEALFDFNYQIEKELQPRLRDIIAENPDIVHDPDFVEGKKEYDFLMSGDWAKIQSSYYNETQLIRDSAKAMEQAATSTSEYSKELARQKKAHIDQQILDIRNERQRKGWRNSSEDEKLAMNKRDALTKANRNINAWAVAQHDPEKKFHDIQKELLTLFGAKDTFGKNITKSMKDKINADIRRLLTSKSALAHRYPEFLNDAGAIANEAKIDKARRKHDGAKFYYEKDLEYQKAYYEARERMHTSSSEPDYKEAAADVDLYLNKIKKLDIERQKARRADNYRGFLINDKEKAKHVQEVAKIKAASEKRMADWDAQQNDPARQLSILYNQIHENQITQKAWAKNYKAEPELTTGYIVELNAELDKLIAKKEELLAVNQNAITVDQKREAEILSIKHDIVSIVDAAKGLTTVGGTQASIPALFESVKKEYDLYQTKKGGMLTDTMSPEDINNITKLLEFREKIQRAEASYRDIPQIPKDTTTALYGYIEKLRQHNAALNQQFIKGGINMGAIGNKNPQELMSSMTEMAYKYMSTGRDGRLATLGDKIKGTFINQAGMIEKFTMKADQGSGAIVRLTDSETEYVSAGQKFANAFKDKFLQISQYVSLIDILREGWQKMKEGIQVVREMDAAMTELKKVTEASAQTYAEFPKQASQIARDIGSTGVEITNAASDWGRQGYSVQDAQELARVTAIYKNVGDNIDIDTAGTSLISTMKGFGLAADEAIDIVDKFNNVSNNFAITSGGIGEALQRSAASFKAANTDLDSAISLLTASNAIVQDPAKVGNAWKTITMRIRGAKTELEAAGEDTSDVVESTSKLRGMIKDLTGFDIMADEHTYKNMKDIIVGIGKEWKNLTDLEQSALLDKLAGKAQGNILAAALNNYEEIENVYEKSVHSTGSALKENEKFMDSINGEIQQLSEAFNSLWINAIPSEAFKGLIDLGTKILDLTDKFGLLETVGVAAFTALKSNFNFGKTNVYAPIG